MKKILITGLEEKIKKLKKERQAVILVHNYQLPEVQDIADYLGDSLELSRTAAKTEAKVVVFCGVHFMAETASILCPDKLVIVPDVNAGCPMANMITADDLRSLKEKHPGAAVVAYVNTSAEVKAESDICCTSTNAVKVVNSLKDKYKEIIFIPDKYLGDYVSKRTGKKLIIWNGYCPTHVKITAKDIISKKMFHPQAKVVVHPECTPEVIALADEVSSTSMMCKFVKESKAKEFIIATESGIIYRLKKENPDKEFYPASEASVCPNMKRTNQEKILWSLEELKEEVRVPDDIRQKALKPIQAMLGIV
ncbi:MAG: quinolinate synthase NadA [Candidatus Omnitrophica bacterium]|nr:quinolinate synthase NadA [Candidatus Omnitrophota bacterium]MDD5236131.1 quinolinate synthase NadA [Candidatus Omnitrophota bacterium]MDD5611204.1 quinolinate synthase NadA [Candidatus Omnitrophota bacterium]